MQTSQAVLNKVLWQISALIGLAAFLALGVNQIRSDRLPLVGGWSAETRFTDPAGASLIVSLDNAKTLFESDAALFLDARSRSEFARGHVRGALSLPWQGVDGYFMEIADRFPMDKTIITYCDGETCDLSHELALFLKEMGFADVRVLVNGWTVWQRAGLPTDEGA
jgi:rhodanese-related sulfurtransferase